MYGVWSVASASDELRPIQEETVTPYHLLLPRDIQSIRTGRRPGRRRDRNNGWTRLLGERECPADQRWRGRGRGRESCRRPRRGHGPIVAAPLQHAPGARCAAPSLIAESACCLPETDVKASAPRDEQLIQPVGNEADTHHPEEPRSIRLPCQGDQRPVDCERLVGIPSGGGDDETRADDAPDDATCHHAEAPNDIERDPYPRGEPGEIDVVVEVGGPSLPQEHRSGHDDAHTDGSQQPRSERNGERQEAGPVPRRSVLAMDGPATENAERATAEARVAGGGDDPSQALEDIAWLRRLVVWVAKGAEEFPQRVNEQSSCEQHQRHRPEWLLQHGAKDPGRAGGPALDSHRGGKGEATDEEIHDRLACVTGARKPGDPRQRPL